MFGSRLLCGFGVYRAVVVTLTPFRMMEMSTHQIVGVVAVWNRFVAASGSMLVVLIVTTAIMSGRARCGITRAYGDHMLINMAGMQVVHVSVMEIIRVSFVFNGSVSATRAVLMRMAVVPIACHDLLPSERDVYLRRCADAWARCLADRKTWHRMCTSSARTSP
jgi:hypothetical protein